ncbi:MAG: transketolase [Myxococcota bacterium]
MSDLPSRAVNTIRALSIDAVQNANSGHPGLPLGAAPMAYALWQNHLRHAPSAPQWPDRDRFVLSAGHGSMLLYSMLHLTGYDVTLDDVKSFRKLHSKTPGHPESFETPGVEATTGPLGQGTANAVGMAIAERFLANHFNRPDHSVVDHWTYAIVSDGDLMEGISAEAASLAGHLKLGKLIYLYDANDISLDGPTSLTFTEDVAARYASYGWHVATVEDGDNDLDGMGAAIEAAKADERPSIIVIKTTIGFGSPNKAGTSSSHGSPLGPDEVALTKKALGLDPEAHFAVADDVASHLNARDRGEELLKEWNARFAAYETAHPELAAEWKTMMRGELPDGWDASLPTWKAGDKLATRKASGAALNGLAKNVPWLFGGDADLSVSTNTALKDMGSFDGVTGAGRNVHYGVREHAMTAIGNGICYHGGPRHFVATFFVFSDYMRPSVRIAALSQLPLISVWTHDSVGLGEDGPTHQPVEHLASLRAMPNLHVIRPADANETAEAWKMAMLRTSGPTGIVLSRQGLPVFDRDRLGAVEGVHRGAYVLKDSEGSPQVILIGTGSEVSLAMDAAEALESDGIKTRVVSMPCWEAFAEQDQEYRDTVLPPTVKARVSVEAGSTFGWRHWVGDGGAVIGLDRIGASGPGPEVMESLGFSIEAVIKTAKSLL